jgi:hypothetical protein
MPRPAAMFAGPSPAGRTQRIRGAEGHPVADEARETRHARATVLSDGVIAIPAKLRS